MKILILNESPQKHGNTAAMAAAFIVGAEAVGHTVDRIDVGDLKISGCLGCNYCRGKGNGSCIQNDDHQIVYNAMRSADMLVIASPIYYFMLSAQTEAVIQRMHVSGIPANIKKTALLLSSGSDGVYDAAILQYHLIFRDYLRLEDMGIVTAHGSENRSQKKEEELKTFGRSI